MVLVVEQWDAANVKDERRKLAKWSYVLKLLEDKKLHLEAVIKIYMVEKKAKG